MPRYDGVALNERSRQDSRGGRLGGSDIRKALESSAVGFDSKVIDEAQRWGEAFLLARDAWRHREMRRRQGGR